MLLEIHYKGFSQATMYSGKKKRFGGKYFQNTKVEKKGGKEEKLE